MRISSSAEAAEEAAQPSACLPAASLVSPHIHARSTASPSSPGTTLRRVAERSERFITTPESRRFRKRFFPEASADDWSDWRWQLRARVKSLVELERIFTLNDDEREAVRRKSGSLPVGITPYYATRLSLTDPADGLRRTHIPVGDEYIKLEGEADDPLGEDHDAVVPGLVHRYPDRVLFLATGFCSTYCRYCTRSRMVGEAGGDYSFSRSQWDRALAYIESHSEIRDVLISGGDPLTLSDEKLDYLLSRLRAIRHVEFIRLGSKVPVVLPMRVTKGLVRVLKRYHPLWMSIHVTHPTELTPEVSEAVARLADAGIPLGSQTVLLKGVNDDAGVMTSLVHALLLRRVKPYYLYQCDPITGSHHFRTPVEKGLEIIAALRGHTTGYASPTFVIDAPGGGGKIALLPDVIVGREGDDLLIRNFEGGVYRYPDPGGTLGADKISGAKACA